jgi:hypothetical protein
MSREIAGLQAWRVKSLGISVGDAEAFVNAIHEQVGLVNDERARAVAKFCGVNVVEDKRLPSNIAAIIQDGEIIQFLVFNDA